MTVKLLTEKHLEILSLKGGCTGGLSLHLSKCHIVGNHVSRLNYVNVQYCKQCRLGEMSCYEVSVSTMLLMLHL